MRLATAGAFAALVNQTLSTTVTSNPIYLAGLPGSGTAITVGGTGGATLLVNDTVRASGYTVVNGDKVQLQLTTPATTLTTVEPSVTFTGQTRSWSVGTMAATLPGYALTVSFNYNVVGQDHGGAIFTIHSSASQSVSYSLYASGVLVKTGTVTGVSTSGKTVVTGSGSGGTGMNLPGGGVSSLGFGPLTVHVSTVRSGTTVETTATAPMYIIGYSGIYNFAGRPCRP